MSDLGQFKAGETVRYVMAFNDDQGNAADPISPYANHIAPDGTLTALMAPVKQNSKTGLFGGTIDTTGFAVGCHFIHAGGTVATDKTPHTVFTLRVIANNEKDVYDRIGAPAGASVSADVATVNAYVDTLETNMTIVLGDLTTIKGYTDSLETAVGVINGFVDEVETILKSSTYGLAKIEVDIGTLLTRLTSGRSLLLDNLSNLDGSVNSAITAANNAKAAADNAKTSADTASTNAANAKISADESKAAANNAVTAIGTLPTVAQLVDGVYDELAAEHNMADTFGNKINMLSTGGIDTGALAGAIADQVNATLAGGSIPYIYTLTTSDGLPIADAEVRVTTDSAPGKNIVALDRTNDFGAVTVLLDAGTYYVWPKKSGVSFEIPAVIEVSAVNTTGSTIGTPIRYGSLGDPSMTFSGKVSEMFTKYSYEERVARVDFAGKITADDELTNVVITATADGVDVTDTLIGEQAMGQKWCDFVVIGGAGVGKYKIQCKGVTTLGMRPEIVIDVKVISDVE